MYSHVHYQIKTCNNRLDVTFLNKIRRRSRKNRNEYFGLGFSVFNHEVVAEISPGLSRSDYPGLASRIESSPSPSNSFSILIQSTTGRGRELAATGEGLLELVSVALTLTLSPK